MVFTYKSYGNYLLIEICKKKLASLAGISSTCIAKLRKNENISTDILLKICVALNCDISVILKITKKDNDR